MNTPILHVVAGVLRDAYGRVLVAQRPAGKHLAGTWEFPGGKCEAGEPARAALARELHEELGVDIGAVEPLISLPWAYPEKRLRFEAYRVQAFRGEAHAREGQALRWCALDELDALPMPPADRPIVTALRLPKRYAISNDPAGTHDAAFLAALERALQAGVSLLQLRMKETPAARTAELARAARDRCAAAGAHLLINGDVALALALDAGVHLPSASLLACRARPLPAARWVAASCHDSAELAHAARIGVDFAVLGPVKPTASHASAQPLGWSRFAALCADAQLPVYALGGLREDDLADALAAGAQGIAGISAFAR